MNPVVRFLLTCPAELPTQHVVEARMVAAIEHRQEVEGRMVAAIEHRAGNDEDGMQPIEEDENGGDESRPEGTDEPTIGEDDLFETEDDE